MHFESSGFAELYRQTSIRGWQGLPSKVDSRFLHLYGDCGRIDRFEDLGIGCCCYWSSLDIVGFEFAISGDWQGDVCNAWLGETYWPPWYMFGSLEPREEMANAGENRGANAEVRPDDTLTGERARHGQSHSYGWIRIV